MSPLRLVVVSLLLLVVACTRPKPAAPPPGEQAPPDIAAPVAPKRQTFSATAYSIEGRTASGVHTREGVVAADPRVLPLGSRIRVHDAGEYDGEYVVRDTGAAVKGQDIDIYIANDAEAKRFGRRAVKVEILERGD